MIAVSAYQPALSRRSLWPQPLVHTKYPCECVWPIHSGIWSL